MNTRGRNIMSEEERIEALNKYMIAGTEPEHHFDSITQMLTIFFKTPMAFISFVNEDFCYFKSRTANFPVHKLPRDQSICTTAIVNNEPTTYPDTLAVAGFRGNPVIENEGGIRSYAGAPITTAEGANIGMVCIADTVPRSFSIEEQELLAGFSQMVMNNVEMRLAAKQKNEVLQQMVKERSIALENIREDERTHIAREVHDELGQQLTAIKLDLSWMLRKMPDDEGPMVQKIHGTIDLVDTAIASVRRIAAELRPSILNDLGLPDALEWYATDFAKRAEVKVDYYCGCRDIEIPQHIATHLFRVVQEAFTNIVRHAKASNVSLSLVQEDGVLVLTISDDGQGFDAQGKKRTSSNGLMGIRERMLLVDGKCRISSAPGQGTIITVSVPLH